MAGVYYLLQDSAGFDRMMHGKSPKKQEKQRSLEDFIVSMQRVISPPKSLLSDMHDRFPLSTRLWHRTLKRRKCRQLFLFFSLSPLRTKTPKSFVSSWMPSTFVFPHLSLAFLRYGSFDNLSTQHLQRRQQCSFTFSLSRPYLVQV
jgi:hypothetical protein